MGKRGFSLYDIEQFMREAGAEQVTEDAVVELEKELERIAHILTDKTLTYARHAGRRKLIKKSDIMLTKHGLV
ncbi:MAG: histone-like protein [Candidatus Micrarchaeales archaeon]